MIVADFWTQNVKFWLKTLH